MSEIKITAQMVGQLRERTSAPMLDCRKALQDTNGDIDAAIDLLRKAGQAKADKKVGRATAEGMIAIERAGDNIVMLQVNCETDFVARDSNFTQFVQQAVKTAAQKACGNIQDLLACSNTETNTTLEEARQMVVTKTGENIQLGRLAILNTQGLNVGDYVHGAGRIGVLLSLRGGSTEMAKDIAMHIAAADPHYLSEKDIPLEVITHEKSIIAGQPDLAGKPAEMVAKITEGRIKKWFEEVCLLNQTFVKDPTQTVGQLVQKANAEIVRFERFKLGETEL